MYQVDDAIELLDRGDLEHRLKLLSASYKEEKGKAQDLLGRMKHMHGELMHMQELSRAHAALQEAHTAQNHKLQVVLVSICMSTYLSVHVYVSVYVYVYVICNM